MSAWTWAAASSRGTSHEKTGTRLQDAFACFSLASAPHTFAAIVSDGAGSASHGGQGASLVCKTLRTNLVAHFATTLAVPSVSDLEAWIDAVRDRISTVALRRGLSSRDFAATLVCAISNGAETVVVHVGDGCAVVRNQADNCWQTLLWPDHGEYASTTFFITDEGGAKVRFAQTTAAVTGLAVFSDGIERLALDFSTLKPFQPFFQAMAKPIDVGQITGRDATLCGRLRAYLGSEKVIARTDDDKTLVLAVYR